MLLHLPRLIRAWLHLYTERVVQEVLEVLLIELFLQRIIMFLLIVDMMFAVVIGLKELNINRLLAHLLNS
jgi:hypothetical protein